MSRTSGRALFLAVVGAFVVVQLLSPAVYEVGPVRIEASAGMFDLGYTRLAVPPLGSVSARTHLTPVQLNFTLQGVDLEFIERLGTDERDQAVADLVQAARAASYRFGLRQLVLGAMGGAGGALVAGVRTPAAGGLGALAGAGTIVAVGLATTLTYDYRSFAHPRYEGILAAAPWMVGLGQEMIKRGGDLSDQLALVGENVGRMLGQVDQLGALAQPVRDRTVLLVSDIHNNPLAVEFMGRVARTFDVDMVIDAGDLTDFGLALEAGLTAGITGFGVPYLLAPGNHEAPEVLSALSEQGVTVLDGTPVTVAGVTVLGLPDSGSSRPLPAVDPVPELNRQRDELREVLPTLSPRPAIVVAHHPRVADGAVGLAPVVVSGHTHQVSVSWGDGSAILNPGTTGASGLRGLTTRQEVPFSLIVLYLAADDDHGWRAAAADTIQVFNLDAQFTLERIVFGDDEDTRPGR